jgi:hypothetical protein
MLGAGSFVPVTVTRLTIGLARPGPGAYPMASAMHGNSTRSLGCIPCRKARLNHGRTVFNSLLLVWHVNITFFGTGFALFQILRFFACHRPEIGSLADTINPTSFPLARNLSCFGGSPWFFFLFSCFLLPFFLFFSFLRKGF